MILIIPLNMLSLGVSCQYGWEPRPWFFVHLVATIIAYYAILEGVWGASIGKRLVGLRVVLATRQSSAGGEPCGRAQLDFRDANFVLLAIRFVVGEAANGRSSRWNHLCWLPRFRLLGLSCRASVLNCPTQQRVRRRPRSLDRNARRPPGQGGSAPSPRSGDRARHQRRRPTAAHGSLRRDQHVGLLPMLDPFCSGLIPVCGAGCGCTSFPWSTPKVAPLIRDLNRPGRLRWLGERRTSTESWDAYEALDGGSLVTLLDRPQPWSAVRAWLADLAQEIDGRH